MTEDDGSNDGPDQIKDPEAYVNQRRLQQLFDLRESLHERQLKIVEIESNRRTKYSKWDAINAYRSLVNSYVLELEPIFRRYEQGPKLLNEKDFGTVKVPPHSKKKQIGMGSNKTPLVYQPSDSSSNSDGYVTIKTLPNQPVEYELEGLSSVLELPSPLTAQYTLRKDRGGEFVHTARTQIRSLTLRSMVRTANNFLADIGFTVEPKEEKPTLKL